MNNIKCTTLRFNLDKPLNRQAWEYLQSMDKEKFKSYSQAGRSGCNGVFQAVLHA